MSCLELLHPGLQRLKCTEVRVFWAAPNTPSFVHCCILGMSRLQNKNRSYNTASELKVAVDGSQTQVFFSLLASLQFNPQAQQQHLLTYYPSCHRQLGQHQILSISGGRVPVSVRFPMNVPWLSPLPQQYVSMSSLDARVFCVSMVSIRLLLLGRSFDLCEIYGLSISSVYALLWFLYFLAGIYRKGPDLKLFEARRSSQFFEDF